MKPPEMGVYLCPPVWYLVAMNNVHVLPTFHGMWMVRQWSDRKVRTYLVAYDIYYYWAGEYIGSLLHWWQ